ncbi:ATP-dependent RNA helicase HrpA [Gordonia sp. ABSL1-1]|uniref:ATP-dependent RNA helicase HrpA n=1 Tax=Gordonia sp. ABSL1-1 TaxID=3053923 RepID=UPI002573F558|nr:ATP-dependent RNA helicase HrpA [Gordonia sp. ABSL1-1]MDL9936366.1 ATP-dependent RNA helicase HrpA [Gordonia sp. ABSL1-1]
MPADRRRPRTSQRKRTSSSPERAAFRAAIAELTIADEHRLRRRLDNITEPSESEWTRLHGELDAGRQRIARRRSAVPVLRFPEELPVSAARDEIAAAITDHQVVVIAGETGSGKTTQLPKICLELGRGVRGLIGHTQPRRIAASSVARRIADETGTEIGDVVGYSVRFTDRSGDNTLIRLMTDGILLREIGTDPMLRRYDTLIIDEAHERSLNIDFILGYLHRLLPRRPDLKVIITSATIEPERFARHFATADAAVPIIEVSGRTYPVDVRYRPLTLRENPDHGDDSGGGEHADLDQIQGIDAAIDELWADGRGDILVFLPTERDIRETADALRRRASAGAEIVPLYARLSIADQQRVFSPSDGRRIVLATNVAETSVTVPGIRYVIDTGTARISRYSTRTKVNRLPIEPVSQASARQRAGRCGRVAPGICIRLYDQTDFDTRPAFTDPEILRTNLASVILQMTSLRLGDVADFPFVQPPDQRAIRDGIGVLTELGAIDIPETRDGRPATPRLTEVGRSMARLPVDPRIARMLTTAHELGCLDHVVIIAAALSLPDVRERPTDHREAADALHRRFVVPNSDFLSYLQLWDHLSEQRSALSGNQFRRSCEREFLHYLRIREWQDLTRQLNGIVGDLDWSTTPTERDADAIHRSILSGLLSNIAVRQTEGREFTGARNTTLMIFPGSSLAKKPPAFIMAAEVLETSRLFAHTVAGVDPLWAEKLAGNLVKRNYSEPHWSAKRGAAMAYERVTLYGVTLVAQRRVLFGPIDPATARELFIRHALVEGDWRTEHPFFARNRALLDAAADVEHRVRRRGLTITEDQLFDFYDERVGPDVVSARHFDTWWRTMRKNQPALLDLTEADVNAGATVADTDFPGAWQQGDTRLRLRYRFEPGAPDDGVTVLIPAALLPHMRTPGFDWTVPGMRAELAAALIKSLPKQLRKTMSPAQRFADLALARLTPRSEPLTVGLARELSAITTTTITADDFDATKLPTHLRMHFALVADGDSDDVRDTDDSLETLQQRHSGARDAPTRTRKLYTSWTADGIGTLAAQQTVTVAGQQLTRYPAVETIRSGAHVGISPTLASSTDHRDRQITDAVATLLEIDIAPLPKKIVQTLDPAGRLALSQSPYPQVDGLLADCTRRAIRDLVARNAALVAKTRDAAGYRALRDALAPKASAAAPEYFRHVVDALREVAPLRELIDLHSGSVAADDVAEQLDHLIFAGFVASTAQPHLGRLARYLRGAATRLDAGSGTRDADALAAVDRVIAHWNQRVAQVPRGRRDHVNEQAHWLVEELRVGLFAQRLGTAYPVSEQRALRTLDRLG